MIYRIYRIYKIASSEELKIDCRKAARREQHRGRCKSICRILTTDRRAFALRMGRVKIPHSTCEHDRVRVFLPDPILTSQDLSRRSGNPRYEVACGARIGRREHTNPAIFHSSGSILLILLILLILSRLSGFFTARGRRIRCPRRGSPRGAGW